MLQIIKRRTLSRIATLMHHGTLCHVPNHSIKIKIPVFRYESSLYPPIYVSLQIGNVCLHLYPAGLVFSDLPGAKHS